MQPRSFTVTEPGSPSGSGVSVSASTSSRLQELAEEYREWGYVVEES